MPYASAKQRRLMYAAASGRVRTDGPSPEAARSFIRHAGDEPPGLIRRREEYQLLREAAEGGSTQARVRLDAARRAVQRQEAVSRTRRLLNHVRGH